MKELNGPFPFPQEPSMDLEQAGYNPYCLCDNIGCARHGNCKACKEFHRITEHPMTCKYKYTWKRGEDPVINF